MPIEKRLKTYIFFDESGKPEVYSAKGVNLVLAGKATRYLILAAVRTPDQLKLQQLVTDFKSTLLHDPSLTRIFSPSYSLNALHAQTDYPEIRERFYEFIKGLDVKIDVLVVDKLKCHDALRRNPAKLYGVMAGQLLKNIMHQAERTEVIFSRKDSKLKLRQEMEAEIERVRLAYLEQHPTIEASFALTYQHNSHYTHGGLQVADYVAFGIFQLFERQNRKWYELLRDRIDKIHDICNKKYFTRSNPL